MEVRWKCILNTAGIFAKTLLTQNVLFAEFHDRIPITGRTPNPTTSPIDIFCLFQRRMCYKLNQAQRIAKTSRKESELSKEQFNRYEELDNVAQQANKSSMAAAYVSIMKCWMMIKQSSSKMKSFLENTLWIFEWDNFADWTDRGSRHTSWSLQKIGENKAEYRWRWIERGSI